MKSSMAAALVVCLMSAPGLAQNLLVNGDFESGAASWTEWQGWGSNLARDYNNTEPGHVGSACLKLGQGNTQGSYGVHQEVAVTPGKSYRIDAYWKGQYNGSSGWYEVIIIDGAFDLDQADNPAFVQPNFMYAYDNPDNPMTADFGWVWAHNQNGTAVDWNGYGGVRAATGNTMTVVLKAGACCGTTGVGGWFDEVSLVEVTPDANLVQNGDFSDGLTDWSTWTLKDNDLTIEVTSGELSISGDDMNAGVYQQFNTEGAGSVVTVTGFWRSDPTLANSMWGEVWVINANRVPVNNVGEIDGFDDAILLYKNDTFGGRGAWSDAIPKSAPVNHEVSFTAAGNTATLILKSGNVGPATPTGVKFDNLEVRSVPAPATLASLPTGFLSRSLTFPVAHMVCIAQSPVSRYIYAISNEASSGATRLYRVHYENNPMTWEQIGSIGSTINYVQGLTFDADGNMYASSKEGKIAKGVDTNPDPASDSFNFSLILDIPDNLLGLGSGDHGVGGLAVGSDDKLYINSGSASHYGYHSNGSTETFAGKWNSRILRCNLDGSGLETFCEGIRNFFDIAFRIDGSLFGVGNGPNTNCDYAEKFSMLEQGNHYGFPYEYGSDLSGGDASITCNNPAGGGVEGPPSPPGGFVGTPTWANYGPDAKPGPGDLGYADGQEYYGFDPHRSPDGIDFYDTALMDPGAIKFPIEFHGRAFVAHFGELEAIPAVGHDVTSQRLDDANQGFVCNTFLDLPGARPIDVLCGHNGRLYVLEFTFSGGSFLHEISYTEASGPIIALDRSQIDRVVYVGDDLTDDGFVVDNIGIGTLNYTVGDNAAWLSVAPPSGNSTGEADLIDVLYDVSGLPCGTYPATITVTDTATSAFQTIDVTVEVRTVLPDFDCDTDVDQKNFGHLQACYSGPGIPASGGCQDADLDKDLDVDQADLTEFMACVSGEHIPANRTCDGVLQAEASATRGGALYDRWWTVIGVSSPSQDHPLWALRPDQVSNPSTGPTTHRCKECHGWDYKGVDGQYGAGSHRTGFPGIFGTTKTFSQLVDLLKNNSGTTPNGHHFGELGWSDADVFDAVKFVLDGQVDTDLYIDGSNDFLGNVTAGMTNYEARCSICHEPTGTGFFPPGHDTLGQIATDNPWEVMHKIRFGQPGTPMPTAEGSGWSTTDAVDTGAYVQTLPLGQVP